MHCSKPKLADGKYQIAIAYTKYDMYGFRYDAENAIVFLYSVIIIWN